MRTENEQANNAQRGSEINLSDEHTVRSVAGRTSKSPCQLT